MCVNQEDILSIWNRTSNDQMTTSRIRDTLRRVLNLPTNTIMEYKTHNDSLRYYYYFCYYCTVLLLFQEFADLEASCGKKHGSSRTQGYMSSLCQELWYWGKNGSLHRVCPAECCDALKKRSPEEHVMMVSILIFAERPHGGKSIPKWAGLLKSWHNTLKITTTSDCFLFN